MKLHPYLRENGVRLLLAVAIGFALCLGVVDPGTALAGGILLEAAPTDLKALHAEMQKAFAAMQESIKKVQDTAENAREEVRKEGTLHAETNKKLTELHAAASTLQGDFKTVKDRVQDVEQKLADKPRGDPAYSKTAGLIIAESDQYKAMRASGEFRMAPVTVPRATISNPTPATNDNPLVPADRQAGIVMPAMRRLTIRDLIPQLRTTQNLVEYCRELVFTNNAGPQYDATSPTAAMEGVPKNQSNITFELASAAVITLAHWIGATRQVLSDAVQLRGYIDTRLSYGLKLEEEDEMLNSAGANGELNGLINQATAFTGGSTNQTFLDTLLKAMNQVRLAEYEPSGVVMHPTDWTNLQLAKDTTGRYLFSDPQAMTQPRVWGMPAVPTASITQGTWVMGAFDLACAIYDREDISVRVSDQHQDFFTRNLVAILVEERLALAIYRAAAIVTGSVSYAG